MLCYLHLGLFHWFALVPKRPGVPAFIYSGSALFTTGNVTLHTTPSLIQAQLWLIVHRVLTLFSILLSMFFV